MSHAGPPIVDGGCQRPCCAQLVVARLVLEELAETGFNSRKGCALHFYSSPKDLSLSAMHLPKAVASLSAPVI